MTQHEQFSRALVVLSRKVSRLQTSEVCCGGLTPEQFETMQAVEKGNDLSMSSLSTALGVDLSTMSRNISVLQREGYVSRSRNRDDSRIVTVVLTRKGTNALATLRCDEKDVMAKLYNRIPFAKRAAALEGLELVRSALEIEDDAGADAGCCAEPRPKGASAR